MWAEPIQGLMIRKILNSILIISDTLFMDHTSLIDAVIEYVDGVRYNDY